ncbi:MAG: hypothetical protein PUE64_12250, partial [Firmicutes bacterium]|nr:hypothetical protein [Bacillota bacterium]
QKVQARWPKGRAPLMIILIRAGGLLQSPGMEVVTLQHEALYPVNSNRNRRKTSKFHLQDTKECGMLRKA